jgi:zinc-binding alcohol dehydrogenase family protein
VLSVQKDDSRSLGADQIVVTDSDDEIASLPALNAIADTVGGRLIGKLVPKLAPWGTLGSVLGKPKAAEGKDIRVEAVLTHPDASLLGKLAEAVRTGSLVILVAREFTLRDAGEAQTLSERRHQWQSRTGPVTARRKLLFYSEIVSDAGGGGAFVHCHDALQHFLVGNREPLMLPQMLKPGFYQELFHISAWPAGSITRPHSKARRGVVWLPCAASRI